jgi:hypothetical protein
MALKSRGRVDLKKGVIVASRFLRFLCSGTMRFKLWLSLEVYLPRPSIFRFVPEGI